ncbi:hypothetical protein YC2023_123278 [Brassica napus]
MAGTDCPVSCFPNNKVNIIQCMNRIRKRTIHALIRLRPALSLNTMVKQSSKDPPLLGESSSSNTTKRKRGRPLGVRNKVKAPAAGSMPQHFAPQYFDLARTNARAMRRAILLSKRTSRRIEAQLRPHEIIESAELKEKEDTLGEAEVPLHIVTLKASE